MRPDVTAQPPTATRGLVDEFRLGLDAPICLTWELTYACNLSCVHCLSSSGRRDPRELGTDECKAVIEELERLQVFYVNIGGGEPMLRPDFFDLVDHAVAHHVGVKFSTNGTFIDAAAARRLAGTDYLDVQVSLDGATAGVNDAVRGDGSYPPARRAIDPPAHAGFGPFKNNPARSCASPACARPAGAPTPGTASTRPRPSSGTCTTGCSAATTSSRATRSSTCRRSATPSPGSTSAAPAAWCA